MLTQKEIYDQAKKDSHDFPLADNAHKIGFVRGAAWANEQNAAEIARLQVGLNALWDFLHKRGLTDHAEKCVNEALL